MGARRSYRSLTAFRHALNLSQADAARLVDITQSQWSRVESGTTPPSLALAQRLADKTGVSLERLAAMAAAARRRRRERRVAEAAP